MERCPRFHHRKARPHRRAYQRRCGGIAIKNVVDQTKAEIDRAIQLNLNSVIYAANVFAPIFQKQCSGTIINMSSVCARQCWPEWSVYAAAKAGVLNFSKGLYTELQPYGVRVTCLLPASAATRFQLRPALTMLFASSEPTILPKPPCSSASCPLTQSSRMSLSGASIRLSIRCDSPMRL